MLLSTSGTRTTPLPHTCDAAPIKSKVAPQLTAAQGIDYNSTACTVLTSLHREGHRRHMNCHTVVDTLYVVITTPRSCYIWHPWVGTSKRIVCGSYVRSAGDVESSFDEYGCTAISST